MLADAIAEDSSQRARTTPGREETEETPDGDYMD
jgi:hypothetical protein